MRNTKLFALESCRKCNRKEYCDNTCEDAYNEFNSSNPQFSKNNDISQTYKGDVARGLEDGNSIEDLFDFNVEDIEWLRILNGKMSFVQLFDKDALYTYLKEKNEQYCEENSLCPVCRNPLVERVEYEEYWGSRQVSERLLVCQYGCE